MGTPITTIRNIGPATAAEFHAAGITDAETVCELGADAAYLQLLRHGTRPHFIGYYALVMGLAGRHWNDCRGAEKSRLRARFDGICSTAAAEPPAAGLPRALSDALDAIGVRGTARG